MGHIELSTSEFAIIVNKFINKSSEIENKISIFKGNKNGFTFDYTIKKLGLSKSVPLNIIFDNFDEKNNILVLGIASNSKKTIYQKLLKEVLNKKSDSKNIILSDYGCEIRENYLYVDTNIFARQNNINSNFTEIKIESYKLSIS